jgi:pimeloyl-ACP methyl ester carboxylesterase
MKTSQHSGPISSAETAAGGQRELQEGRVTANGLDFAYLATGSGPLALCLHGFPESPYTYRHLMPALAGAGFRVVAPFMRGFAPTAIPADDSYTISDLINDANGLHEALEGDDNAVIIANDWGACAGWGAAAQAPERWRKVVIANIPPLQVLGQVLFSPRQIHSASHFWFFQMAIADAVVAAQDFAFLDHLWATWSPGYDASADLIQVKECLRDPANLAAALGYYRAMFDPSRFGSEEWTAEQGAAWGSIPSQPTLYLHGTNGPISLDDANLAQIGGLLAKGSDAAWVEGAGHFLLVEKPADVNNRIRRFLEAEV